MVYMQLPNLDNLEGPRNERRIRSASAILGRPSKGVYALCAFLTVVITLSAEASPIYAIRPDGGMMFYRDASAADGSTTWAVQGSVIGSDWQRFSQVLAGGNGAIYAIHSDGQMLFYRYSGAADGSAKWAVEQKPIGSGWQGFSHVFAGENGAIYAIRPNGDMLYYRYAGMADGSGLWAVQGKVIGSGWQEYKRVFGAYNGAIYAMRPDGQLMYYRFTGMSTGAPTWAVQRKPIGSNWQAFSQVAAGENGAIYAVKPDGQMLLYKYAGGADGSDRWTVQGKPIGTGWDFKHIAVGGEVAGAETAPHPGSPPKATTMSNPDCAKYARTAVADYQDALRVRKCSSVVSQEPGRWHDQLQRHYDWCETASVATRKSEMHSGTSRSSAAAQGSPPERGGKRSSDLR